jgi:hypothetical protein
MYEFIRLTLLIYVINNNQHFVIHDATLADGKSAYERQLQTHLSSKGRSCAPSLLEFIL